MIRNSVNTLVLAFCFTAGLLANPAAAQNAAPALRANVTVTGDIVRIGDLVEHAGAVAPTCRSFARPISAPAERCRPNAWSKRSGRISSSALTRAEFPKWW